MEITDIQKFEPTAVAKIAVGDLTAPVQTGVELSKLAVLQKSIVIDLLQNSKRDKDSNILILHPDALPWVKEYRMTLKDIDLLTKGVQEKMALKQIDLVGEIYKQALKNMDSIEIVRLVKKLEKGIDVGSVIDLD
jgi:hypothetical protein